VFPVLIPVRRRGPKAETAGLVATLGGALILLGAFFLGFNSTLALLGFLFGAGIIALAALATSRPRHAGPAGAGIVVLGLASLVTGGGFYIGWVVAVIGGILIGSPYWQSAPRVPTAPFPSEALGPLCPTCGRHIPTWSSQCPYCGAPENVPR
jgi:hypothetical protein